MPHRILTKIGLPPAVVNFLCVFAFPAGAGAGGGVSLLSAHDWGHPYVIYVLTSLVIQLLLVLMNHYFKERSQNMTLLTDQIERIERRSNIRSAEESLQRHELANQVQSLIFQNWCLLKGLPMDNPPPPLYDIAQERAALTALVEVEGVAGIHVTKVA